MSAARGALHMAGKRLSSPSFVHAKPTVPFGSSSSTSTPSMASIIDAKRQLRSRIRRELRLHHSSLKEAEDSLIQNHILSASWYRDSYLVCTYLSTPSLREVDTTLIVSNIMQSSSSGSGKRLYVPWVEDKEGHMRFFHVTSLDDLHVNSMGISEPTPVDEKNNAREDVMQALEPIDLVLMPGLAFDRMGRRLGRGGGYYDTFLRKYLQHVEQRGWNPPLLVGLAYSSQILDEDIPTCATDVSIDALVSANGVLPITSHFWLAHQ